MGFSRAGIGVFVVVALGFSRAGIGVFVVAASRFLGARIGVFVVAALGFLGAGIGVFVAAALVFLWPRHWCLWGGRGIGVCRAQGATGFFLGENLEPRKKSGKTLMRTRVGQAKGPRRRIHARIHV